jgi:surface antigen
MRHLSSRRRPTWLTTLATVAVAAAAFTVASVPTSARAGGAPGLSTFCWQQNYSCAGGGYAGREPNSLSGQWKSAEGYWSGATLDSGGHHHNCTLYAAYREALNGAPDPGVLGDAAQWSASAKAEHIPVDGTPAVGAIANWTQPNTAMGVGSLGHVAYVEKVTSTYIVTSEDNAFNNFTGGRQIDVGTAAWPNDFIHFGQTTSGPPLASDDPSGGPAVVHSGYTSVFTVNGADDTLQETFLAKNGQPWATQNMSAKFGTPPVAPGTVPVAIFHGGYTSVYTVNAADNTLQETYLPAIGDAWVTQNLSAHYGTPPVADFSNPAVAFHGGYVSVYTVNAADNTLQETYLPKIGDAWVTQNLSAHYGTPPVAPFTSPAALYHTGYTSVYTVNAADYTLQETFLSAIGQPWATQNMSAKFGTPPVEYVTSPAAVVHTDPSGVLDFTSVFTVNAADGSLQETYLPKIGDAWVTQNLSASTGTPAVAQFSSPVALYHTGYTSVYTVNAVDDTLQETFLAQNGKPWVTQNLSVNFGTPPLAGNTIPAAVVHPDSAGVNNFTSVYTIGSSGTVQETYLAAINDPWVTQPLPAPPAVS